MFINIITEMFQKNISHDELAKALNISSDDLKAYILKEKSMPESVCINLSKTLDKPLYYLFEEQEKAPGGF